MPVMPRSPSRGSRIPAGSWRSWRRASSCWSFWVWQPMASRSCRAGAAAGRRPEPGGQGAPLPSRRGGAGRLDHVRRLVDVRVPGVHDRQRGPRRRGAAAAPGVSAHLHRPRRRHDHAGPLSGPIRAPHVHVPALPRRLPARDPAAAAGTRRPGRRRPGPAAVPEREPRPRARRLGRTRASLARPRPRGGEGMGRGSTRPPARPASAGRPRAPGRLGVARPERPDRPLRVHLPPRPGRQRRRGVPPRGPRQRTGRGRAEEVVVMRRAAAIAAACLLALPPADGYLAATMERRLLIQIPAMLVLGALAGWRPAAPRPWRSGDRAALAFAGGAMLFWMIPRSLDLAARSRPAAAALLLSVFAAGLALARSLPHLSFVIPVTLGLQATAMFMALGIVYLHFPGLICTAYTLAQQRVAGAGLVRAAPVAWVLLWGWALRRLAVARSLP